MRLLRLLEHERLNVSEGTPVFGVAKFGVSCHLGLLRTAGLPLGEHEATFTDNPVSLLGRNHTIHELWSTHKDQFSSVAEAVQVCVGAARLRETLPSRGEHRETCAG